jgi:hypothetical protein
MKTQNRISQLTLELYHRGLTTRKETKQVEKALLSDVSARGRYEALKVQEREINQLVEKELSRLNIPKTPIASTPQINKVLIGVILAAAVLLCALVPAFLYVKNRSPNKENVIAETPTGETTHEIETQETETPEEETAITENTPIEEKAPIPKQPVIKERGSSNDMNREVIDENPLLSSVLASGNEFDKSLVLRFRSQSGEAVTPEEDADISIPPGITFIFENMFANKYLVGIVIPDRIKSIAKNAYAGNPVIFVTIGANVDVHDEAIPGNFAKAYNSNGKQAGNYQRPDSGSEAWEKK